MGYERDSIAAIEGYVPGKQPRGDEAIKLNTNENPYPPSPAVLAALTDVDPRLLQRYPDPLADGFRVVAAARHGLTPDHVIAVNGGDELLRLAITTFVDPGRPIGVVEPSYSLYPVLAAIHGSPLCAVPSGPDFAPPADLARRWNEAGAPLCMLVNPHAPSGRLMPAADILALASALDGVLLVDEAYVDFVDPELGHDLCPSLDAHPNLLLLRSLSKGYSLAGLRFGYGLGTPSLVAPMRDKTRDSYNVDVLAQRLATVAVERADEAAETWARVRRDRSTLAAALAGLGMPCLESQTNFLLAAVPPGHSAGALRQALEQHGLLVRHFAAPRLDACLRITVGTPEQNAQLVSALGELLAAPRAG